MSASLAGSSPEPTGRAGVTGSTGASGWAAFLAPQTAEGRWTDWALSGPWGCAALLVRYAP